MHTTSTFTVATFEATDLAPSPAIRTALPIGVARMEKTYEGGMDGRSATLFVSAYDAEAGRGTYVAMEAFEGRIDGRSGTVAYVHSATTSGTVTSDEFLLLVPGSGTGELAGIRGRGVLVLAADGTHHIDLDYELP